MNILVAMDSFKGSLSSAMCGAAIKRAVQGLDNVQVQVLPIADGGEGTVDAILTGLGAEKREITVRDPLSRPIRAYYGILHERKIAVMEMASACGLPLLKEDERNPMRTSTYGLGEMILDAVDQGCRDFLIGIGGSATNDGGLGMLSALGFRFYDKNGKQTGCSGDALAKICAYDDTLVSDSVRNSRFHIACDVTNPLCGQNGAAAVFAPQKGATPKMVQALDAGLANFAAVVRRQSGQDAQNLPGAGAAGGLGYGLSTFLGAELKPGVQTVLQMLQFDRYAQTADLVITGEGCIDWQTAMGKAPIGVAERAKAFGKPVIAFCGSVGEGAERCNAAGIDAYFPITQHPCSLAEAMDQDVASTNLERTARQALRLFLAGSGDYTDIKGELL